MEKLDLSLFDFVRANGEAGLEIRTIQKIAQQILITTAFLHKHKLPGPPPRDTLHHLPPPPPASPLYGRRELSAPYVKPRACPVR